MTTPTTEGSAVCRPRNNAFFARAWNEVMRGARHRVSTFAACQYGPLRGPMRSGGTSSAEIQGSSRRRRSAGEASGADLRGSSDCGGAGDGGVVDSRRLESPRGDRDRASRASRCGLEEATTSLRLRCDFARFRGVLQGSRRARSLCLQARARFLLHRRHLLDVRQSGEAAQESVIRRACEGSLCEAVATVRLRLHDGGTIEVRPYYL